MLTLVRSDIAGGYYDYVLGSGQKGPGTTVLNAWI
jgi:hypothetical protein